jgi:hypothetical protein
VIKIQFAGTYGATKWVNVMHVKYTPGPPVQADMNSLANSLRTAWVTNLAPIMVSTVALSTVTLTDLSSLSGLVAANSAGGNGSVSPTTQLPANVAMVLSLKIARRYRGGHPRAYLPGMSQANTSNANQFGAGFVTSSTTSANAFLTAVNALTFTSMTTIALCAVSYFSGHVLRPIPQVDLISSVLVHNRVDSQRRRLGKEF